MTKDDGGPAFPAQFFDDRATGMTLRDYFAAKAMYGLIASPFPETSLPSEIAETSYIIADAMLKARKA